MRALPSRCGAGSGGGAGVRTSPGESARASLAARLCAIPFGLIFWACARYGRTAATHGQLKVGTWQPMPGTRYLVV